MTMYSSEAPPPYTHSTPSSSRNGRDARGRPNLSLLPLPILYRIVALTLDERATPNRWRGDAEEERVRRVWGLYKGLRGVSRGFWLVATSILRSRYHPTYLSLIRPGYSSDAYPHTSHPSSFSFDGLGREVSQDNTALSSDKKGASGQAMAIAAQHSVYTGRSRETAVLDRFIAFRVGDELRRVESSLTEETGEEKEIFHRFQPTARLEDLLLTLPRSLISPLSPPTFPPDGSLPLPQPCLSITLTPGWCQLYIWSDVCGTRGAGRDMVFEVKRMETLEGTATMVQYALEQMQRGTLPWGMAKYEGGLTDRYRTFERTSSNRR